MTVMLVSDIHLCKEREDLTNAFVNFLNTTAKQCNKLYLLGDIFEAWIGDDYQDPSMTPVLNSLRSLSASGCKLFFQHGNRDFLVGEALANSIGAILLKEQEIIELPSEQALIMHGDQLCTDDIEYQNFRTMVRSEQWQQAFLSKPINERIQIAEQLRATSKEKTGEKALSIIDVNPAEVNKVINNAQIRLLIHGHTHRPARHTIKTTTPASERIVLGDWDKTFWYLKCDSNGCHLIEQDI